MTHNLAGNHTLLPSEIRNSEFKTPSLCLMQRRSDCFCNMEIQTFMAMCLAQWQRYCLLNRLFWIFINSCEWYPLSRAVCLNQHSACNISTCVCTKRLLMPQKKKEFFNIFRDLKDEYCCTRYTLNPLKELPARLFLLGRYMAFVAHTCIQRNSYWSSLNIRYRRWVDGFRVFKCFRKQYKYISCLWSDHYRDTTFIFGRVRIVARSDY